MPVTFHSREEAHEYADQKEKEGYKVNICAGTEKAGKSKKDLTYTVKVIGKTSGLPKRSSRFTARNTPAEITKEVSMNKLLNSFERAGWKPTRSRDYIRNFAMRKLKEAGIANIEVEVKRTKGWSGEVDMGILYDTEGPKELVIHPIHQYTNREPFEDTIMHEIEHIKSEK